MNEALSSLKQPLYPGSKLMATTAGGSCRDQPLARGGRDLVPCSQSLRATCPVVHICTPAAALAQGSWWQEAPGGLDAHGVARQPQALRQEQSHRGVPEEWRNWAGGGVRLEKGSGRASSIFTPIFSLNA